MTEINDLSSAHRHFSAHCFNETWDLIEKPGRSPEEDRLMVALCHASIYHWRSREDCTDRNLSIGYWQASRVEAVLGNAEQARRWAEVCLEYSRELAPFYRGYAYEALARAAKLANLPDEVARHSAAVRELASQVEDPEASAALLKDIESLATG